MDKSVYSPQATFDLKTVATSLSILEDILGLASSRQTGESARFLPDIAAKKGGENAAGGWTFVRSRVRASVMLVVRAEARMYGIYT